MGKKYKKSRTISQATAAEKYKHSMKMVTSETCFVCKSQCAKGLTYLERMSVPGAVGKGVPCILTKGKAFK
nr:hypothetical protein [Halalkalibacterium ligniniphilum]